ncbi:MAG: tetratricopeptide repeat protein, partial [Verrucomicrobiota bacterium]
MKLTKKITLALGLAIGSFSFAQTYPLSENFWTSPEFQDRVMGSYGMHTGLEPKINEEEGLLFKELLVLLDQNMELGRDRLKNAITPESSAALSFMLGTVNLQLGDLEASVEAYKSAIKKFPNFMRAYKSAGYALAQANQYEEATKYLVKGMELGGADGTTCGLLGYSYLNLDKYGAALNAYNLAMAYEPDTIDWQLGKVRCLIYMQAYGEAQGLLEDLLLKDLDNSELWLHQANTKLAMDLAEEAATNLEIVRRMGQASLASLTLLGDIYENRAMHKLAFEVYSEALDRTDGIKALSKVRRLASSLVQYEEYEYANKIAERAMSRFESEMETDQEV